MALMADWLDLNKRLGKPKPPQVVAV